MTPHSLLSPLRLGGQPVLRSQTDERLVDLASSGSRPAFEAIVSRYRRPLLSYSARFLGAERAEDAVQQTFVKAYTALTGGEVVRNLRPWLYRIAHNTSLNLLRDRALHHEQLNEQIDGVERPDQVAERRQELDQALTAVKALPPRQRDAIVLRALEGRTYEQIAQDLGISDGAVRQLLSRARCSMPARSPPTRAHLERRRLDGDRDPDPRRVGRRQGDTGRAPRVETGGRVAARSRFFLIGGRQPIPR